MKKNTQQRHVLITGGSGGIGLALAQQFLQVGDQVTLLDRHQQTLTAAQKRWPQIQTYLIDVTNTQELAALAQQLGTDPAGPDTIINNAGIHIARPLIDKDYLIDEQLLDINAEIQINFTALVNNCVIWRPYLEARKGQAALVNTVSALAFVPKYASAVYCGCKAAVDQFSTVLRMQLEQSHIRVITVYPPLIATAMTGERASNKDMSAEQFAAIFYRQFSQGKDIIRIGEVSWLYYLNRISPRIAAKFIER